MISTPAAAAWGASACGFSTRTRARMTRGSARQARARRSAKSSTSWMWPAAAMARADWQARFARDRIAADVRDAASALEAARQRVEIARQELTLATQVAAQERERFQLGEGTLLFVNLREQAATEAEIRVVDALLDGQRALAAWRFATGQGGASSQLCPE